MINDPLQCFTKAEASKMLGICRRGLERRIRSERIKPVYIGSSVRITREELKRFVDSCCERDNDA
jgi:excisionase family DNA binding protein